jgi:hypothetical protein
MPRLPRRSRMGWSCLTLRRVPAGRLPPARAPALAAGRALAVAGRAAGADPGSGRLIGNQRDVENQPGRSCRSTTRRCWSVLQPDRDITLAFLRDYPTPAHATESVQRGWRRSAPGTATSGRTRPAARRAATDEPAVRVDRHDRCKAFSANRCSHDWTTVAASMRTRCIVAAWEARARQTAIACSAAAVTSDGSVPAGARDECTDPRRTHREAGPRVDVVGGEEYSPDRRASIASTSATVCARS